MNIKVLMITYNRPEYTKKSLTKLCDTAPENVSITIWDNASDSETKEVVSAFETHPRVEKVIFNDANEKLRKPTNWFWDHNRDADLLGKVDDDCLVADNWCQVLETAHKEIPSAGVLGSWRFFEEDVQYDLAKKKIVAFGNHQILRNCWVEGSGYLMKSELIAKFGLLKEGQTFTDYCIRAAAKGYVNGWYYPFLYQEHMDDPRSEHTIFINEEAFQKQKPLGAINFGVKTREDWIQRQVNNAKKIQQYSFNPYDFIGVKAWFKRKILKMTGNVYFPKVR